MSVKRLAAALITLACLGLTDSDTASLTVSSTASLSVTPAGTLSRTITEGGSASDHTRDVTNDGDSGSSLDWSVAVQSQQDCGGTTGAAWATASGSGTGLSPGDPAETATEGYASESGCAPGTYTATIRYTSAEADDSPVDRTLELVVQQQVASNSADACDANADCLCYEPLNADDGPFGLDALVDPSDSATKDCTTFFVEGGGDTVSSIPGEAGLDMPGSGVSWVWEVEQEGNPSVQLGDSLAPSLAPGETICVRHYERANYQHVDDGPSQRARSTRMSANTGSDQAVIQWNFEPTGPSGIKFTITFLGADDNCPATAGSDDVTMDEINSSWARLEHCMDHAADGTVHFRARITVLDTASQWTSECVETGSSGGSTINFGQFWPAQAFSQSGEAGWLRWKSHAGTWKKSFDQSFWPPVACEVEGGC